jgi:hypothetical protein
MKDERKERMTKYFPINPLSLVLFTLPLVLQRKLLYFALSTSYFGESRNLGERRYGSIVKHLTLKAQRLNFVPWAVFFVEFNGIIL